MTMGIAPIKVLHYLHSMTPVTQVRTPSGAQETFVIFFVRLKHVLTRCRCVQPPQCLRTHTNDHVHTLKNL